MATSSNRAFEFTYVDLDKGNKQRRQRRTVRAADKDDAKVVFAAWVAGEQQRTGKRYKAISAPAEVAAEPDLSLFTSVITGHGRKKPKYTIDPAIAERNQQLRALGAR